MGPVAEPVALVVAVVQAEQAVAETVVFLLMVHQELPTQVEAVAAPMSVAGQVLAAQAVAV